MVVVIITILPVVHHFIFCCLLLMVGRREKKWVSFIADNVITCGYKTHGGYIVDKSIICYGALQGGRGS